MGMAKYVGQTCKANEPWNMLYRIFGFPSKTLHIYFAHKILSMYCPPKWGITQAWVNIPPTIQLVLGFFGSPSSKGWHENRVWKVRQNHKIYWIKSIQKQRDWNKHIIKMCSRAWVATFQGNSLKNLKKDEKLKFLQYALFTCFWQIYKMLEVWMFAWSIILLQVCDKYWFWGWTWLSHTW